MNDQLALGLQEHQSGLLSQAVRRYRSVLHAQLEPVNALAFERSGIFEIHTGNQWQSLILPVLAEALRVPQEKIVMRTYSIGGGFGRRLNGDYAVPAALDVPEALKLVEELKVAANSVPLKRICAACRLPTRGAGKPPRTP